MRKVLSLSLLLFSLSAAAAPQFKENARALFTPSRIQTDESINYQPGLNLHPVGLELKDLWGPTKGNQLCAPMAITNAFYFLKYKRNPNFPNLQNVRDMDNDGEETLKDHIRYLFQICNTDREEGTRYHSALDCMRQYIKESGYNDWAYMVGKHAKDAPAGYDISTMRRALSVNIIRTYVAYQPGMLMGVGWYTLNTATNTYERSGGHFFNIYGYDYNVAWGQDQIILKAVNNWIDYTGRAEANHYDDVRMVKIGTEANYPADIAYELKGPGFDHPGFKALAEDIFVMIPY